MRVLFNRRKPSRTIELVSDVRLGRLGIQTKYSKASRYAASRTADLADMRVQIFDGFYTDFFLNFGGFSDHMSTVFTIHVFFLKTKNYANEALL